jgi:hypothetical protein
MMAPMGGMQEKITWPRALLWSLATGLLLAGMFVAVLVGWKWLNPGDPFIASLGIWEVLGFLGAIFAATFGTMFYWFTFMLADRRAARAAQGREDSRKPPV